MKVAEMGMSNSDEELSDVGVVYRLITKKCAHYVLG